VADFLRLDEAHPHYEIEPMRLPIVLTAAAAGWLIIAAASGQPEFIVPALVLAVAAASTRRTAKHKQLARSLAEMEQRLRVTEGELEFTSEDLQHMKVEREFDRQLLREPKPAQNPPA
jgi:hypothetical protein